MQRQFTRSRVAKQANLAMSIEQGYASWQSQKAAHSTFSLPFWMHIPATLPPLLLRQAWSALLITPQVLKRLLL